MTTVCQGQSMLFWFHHITLGCNIQWNVLVIVDSFRRRDTYQRGLHSERLGTLGPSLS